MWQLQNELVSIYYCCLLQYETQHKVEELTSQLEESEDKLVELQKLAELSRTLKDEVDILRDTILNQCIYRKI